MRFVHRSIALQWALFGFLCGIALASFVVLPAWLIWASLTACLVCVFWGRPRALLIGIVGLSALIGLLRTNVVLDRPSILWDLAADKTQVVLDGYVDGDFTPTKTGGQYRFHVVRANGQAVDDNVQIFGSASLRPLYGQVYEISGKIQRANSNADFDYASYLAKSDVHALLYYPEYSIPLDWEPSFWLELRLSIVGRLHGLRDSLAGSINASVRQPEAAYLSGILVGAQGIVPDNIKEMFSRTGTSHILAISGYNITIVAGMLSMLLAPLGRRRSFWFAIGGITVFTVMVGASASVVRAAIMGVMALAAGQFGRQAASGILILLSAAVMCLINPLLLRWDVGFQLSFLALIGIVYIEPLISPLFSKLLRWDWLAGTAATTASASLAVLPLLLFNFKQLAVYTLPVNIIVLPLVPVAMALGFATAVAGLIPVVGQIIGQVAWLVAAFQLSVIRIFSNLPYAALEVHMSWIALVSAYAALATWLIFEYLKSDTKIISIDHHV